MGRMEICPCCGLRSFEYWEGEWEEEGGQISPDTAHCIWCGYDWQQHCQNPPEWKLVKSHKMRYFNRMQKTVAQNTKEIIRAVENREEAEDKDRIIQAKDHDIKKLNEKLAALNAVIADKVIQVAAS